VTATLARVKHEVPDWHAIGACRDYPELDFIDPGATDAFDKPSAADRRLAEAACRIVCSTCPFRLDCATGALERRERWGIWGGLTYEDRKRIAAKYGYLPPGDPPPHGTNSRRVKWNCHCPECRAAHALYEAMRRERKRVEARARDLWRVPVALAVPVRAGRGRALPGQLVMPLAIELPVTITRSLETVAA
jgi:hypothetical protein